MAIRQRESHRTVVEIGVLPAVAVVANLATGRELRGPVIWIRSRLKIRGVAGIALGRQRLELAARGSLVAGVAIYSGMRSS